MNDYSANNNATPYVVAHGPFAGTTPTASELVEHVDQYTGERFLTWDTHARTRRFLEAFPPALGWRVLVTQEYLGLSMADVHASANGMAVEPIEDVGMPRVIRDPINVDGVGRVGVKKAPDLGEHTAEILDEMGFSPSDIERLRSDGVI